MVIFKLFLTYKIIKSGVTDQNKMILIYICPCVYLYHRSLSFHMALSYSLWFFFFFLLEEIPLAFIMEKSGSNELLLLLFVWKCLNFLPCFWRVVYQIQYSLLTTIFFVSTLIGHPTALWHIFLGLSWKIHS